MVVTVKVDGQEYTLSYDSKSGSYMAELRAPMESSYITNDGYYPVEIRITNSKGGTLVVNDKDPIFGESCKLRVIEQGTSSNNPVYEPPPFEWPDIFVLDKNLDAITVIDTYDSMIWTDRYQECGDFELYLPMSKELANYIKQDYYLWSQHSEHVMIIEKLQISSDAENGDTITVTGRSLESLLDRRIVWGLKILSGNFQEGVQTLLNENVISPSKPERKIDNFIFEASDDPAITGLTIETQYTGDNLYDVITKLCAERGIGFKVTLNDQKQFVFKLYAGEDRSYDQTKNPYVVFSPSFDNIITSDYTETKAGLKNVTLVGGEGEGSARRYTAVGNISGLNRRETFTDARDISSENDEDMTPSFVFTQYPSEVYNATTGAFVTDTMFNSCMVDVSEFAGRTIRISIPQYTNAEAAASGYATILVNSSKQYISTLQAWEKYDETASRGTLTDYEFLLPEDVQYIYTSMYSQAAIDANVYYGEVDDFECQSIKLSNDEYIAQLRQRGKETLAENKEVVSFEGQAETTIMFKYGKDFFQGDIVQVADEYGHETKSRVLEVITSVNEEGYSTYPTFATIDTEDETLPDDYIRLDFIESTGTQYIDTGFKPTSNTRVVMDIRITSQSSSTTAPFGVRNNRVAGASEAFVLFILTANSIRYDYFGTTNTIETPVSVTERTEIDANQNIVTAWNATGTNVEASGSSDLTLPLLAAYDVDKIDYNVSGKLYSCQIYDGDVRVRNYIPCKNASDVVGLFDTVNQQFYGNAGTGAFQY